MSDTPAPVLGRPAKSATVSECSAYRYDLTRWWGPDDGAQVVWVMLNPSTADADIDDPTIRRCIGFTKSWGYHGLTVVNLYALRSTDPKALLTAEYPAGPENYDYLNRHIGDPTTAFVVAAWGAFQRLPRRPDIPAIAHFSRKPLRCLGTTKDGSPRHPLYVRADAPLHPFGIYDDPTSSDEPTGGTDG